ncbi:MAG: hypothetical protein U0Y82_05610 [Thermoleophilia bacterium]
MPTRIVVGTPPIRPTFRMASTAVAWPSYGSRKSAAPTRTGSRAVGQLVRGSAGKAVTSMIICRGVSAAAAASPPWSVANPGSVGALLTRSTRVTPLQHGVV